MDGYPLGKRRQKEKTNVKCETFQNCCLKSKTWHCSVKNGFEQTRLTFTMGKGKNMHTWMVLQYKQQTRESDFALSGFMTSQLNSWCSTKSQTGDCCVHTSNNDNKIVINLYFLLKTKNVDQP